MKMFPRLYSCWCALAALVFVTSSLTGRAENALRYYYPLPPADPPQTIEADVCVYGATPGGVTAAVQAARMGKKAVLVEFGKHVGGLTSSGLSATDGGEIAAGIGREFYNAVGKKGFHPADAEAQFEKMLKEAGVSVYRQNRLVEVKTADGRIGEIRMENGNVFRAKVFVDASYEGDLFALAGVSYHIGREANSVYQENYNGIFFGPGHNFVKPVDPYVTPGDPKSGLLPLISADPPGKQGEGDGRIQAYNFRMFFEKGGLPFPKPAGYDPGLYELLLRYIAAGGPSGINAHAGDVNNKGGFSTDNIGANYDWPDGPGRDVTVPSPIKRLKVADQPAYCRALYETREKIYQNHITYQQGLCYFVTNDPRVPEVIRAEMKEWGLSRVNFPETGGWPHQLYVREARRMMSDYVMTEANCQGRTVAEDSVGLAKYTMDSHNCRRLVIDGNARNEGNVEKGTPRPYPVSYRSIVPKESECTNLLVPVNLSASHIAFGSIRMEPVFMVLGQSAGTAAAMAIDKGIPVQKVDYAEMRARLLQDQQMLEWTGEDKPSVRKP